MAVRRSRPKPIGSGGGVVVTRGAANYLVNAGGIMAEVPDGSRSVEEQIEARLRRAGFDVEVEWDGKLRSVACEF